MQCWIQHQPLRNGHLNNLWKTYIYEMVKATKHSIFKHLVVVIFLIRPMMAVVDCRFISKISLEQWCSII